MEPWDYTELTTYTFTKDLVRGTKGKYQYNDQLYIWVHREDYETLGSSMVQWYVADERAYSTYKILRVTINLEKKYPMSILYRGGNPQAKDFELSEYGNIAYADAESIEKYNDDVIPSWKFSQGFGKNVAHSLTSAFKLGRRYERYVAMLQAMDYVMVSDVESGLISEGEEQQ